MVIETGTEKSIEKTSMKTHTKMIIKTGIKTIIGTGIINVLTTITSTSTLIQLYSLLIYWRSFATHMKSRCNVKIEHHLSIFMRSKNI